MSLEKTQRDTYVDMRAWLKFRHVFIHNAEYLKGEQATAHNKVHSISEITFPKAIRAYHETKAREAISDPATANKTKRRKVAQAILFVYDESLTASVWSQLSRLSTPKSQEDVTLAAVKSLKMMDAVVKLVDDGFRHLPSERLLDLPAKELALETHGSESLFADDRLKLMTGLAIVGVSGLTPVGSEPELPDPLIRKLGVAPAWQSPRLS